MIDVYRDSANGKSIKAYFVNCALNFSPGFLEKERVETAKSWCYKGRKECTTLDISAKVRGRDRCNETARVRVYGA